MNSKFIRIFKYFYPFRKLIWLCFFFALMVNLAELASPYIMKVAIDEYILVETPRLDILSIGLIYLVTVIAGAISNYLQVCQLNLIVQKIMYTIRMELFTHIQHLPLSFFDRNSSGRIMTRVTNDVEALNEMYSGVMVAFFKDIFLLIGIVLIMIQLNVTLALLSFTVIPVIILVTFFYKKKARDNFKIVRSLIAQINGFLAENISGMKLVQAFNREKEKFQEFKTLNDKYNQASIFEVILQALFKPSSELINSLAIALLIWYCTPGVFNSTLEIGLLFAFITYCKKFFDPINDLADKYNVILAGSVAAERIFELLDSNHQVEELNTGIPLPQIRGLIEFKHVWFAYCDEDWVLQDVSFTINPGETVAFVGATGSGKSTIINLIGRFYEVQRGEILVDGVNIREIRLGDLRSHIATVMQDVFLFTGDIASNIRLKNETISLEKVIAASEYAHAGEFIGRLPGKYHEEVKERGGTLSAGQRQLLSFARAVAFNPSILVLDEATANIDTETELVIQNSLTKISANRTTLVIAHRLSTIKNADQIIVIDHGKIHEIGKHQELLEQDGIYHKLYEMQFAG